MTNTFRVIAVEGGSNEKWTNSGPADDVRMYRHVLSGTVASQRPLIAERNPRRRSIVIQNVSSTSTRVAWINTTPVQPSTGQPAIGGFRLGQYESLVLDARCAIYGTPDTTDDVTLQVVEEINTL